MKSAWNSTATSKSPAATRSRSEEHTSELQSQSNFVCRLLLENNKILAHVVADLDLVDVLFGDADQRVRRGTFLELPHHLQRLQRIRFERFLAPRQIRCKVAAALNRFDLARLERVGEVERVVREWLVRPD